MGKKGCTAPSPAVYRTSPVNVVLSGLSHADRSLFASFWLPLFSPYSIFVCAGLLFSLFLTPTSVAAAAWCSSRVYLCGIDAPPRSGAVRALKKRGVVSSEAAVSSGVPHRSLARICFHTCGSPTLWIYEIIRRLHCIGWCVPCPRVFFFSSFCCA